MSTSSSFHCKALLADESDVDDEEKGGRRVMMMRKIMFLQE